MNINEAVVVLDYLCGKQGLYFEAWKNVRARIMETKYPPIKKINLLADEMDRAANITEQFDQAIIAEAIRNWSRQVRALTNG